MTAENQTISLRINSQLLAEIDARAKERGISRNQWIEKCTRWSIHNLPYGAPVAERIALAKLAPADVAGSHRVDMGLNDIEGK